MKCACGCNEEISKRAKKYIQGHQNKGIGKSHYLWKENPSYRGLHFWVRRNKQTPESCRICDRMTDGTKRFGWHNISGKYLRDLDDWEWLCMKCHMKKDGRIEKYPMHKGHQFYPRRVMQI